MKVSRLEKKVAGAEEECARKVALEKQETTKFKEALDEQEKCVGWGGGGGDGCRGGGGGGEDGDKGKMRSFGKRMTMPQRFV